MRECVFESPEITFRFPESWQVEVDEGVVSVFDPVSGVGALQFSLFPVDSAGPEYHHILLEKYLKEHFETYEIKDQTEGAIAVGEDEDGTVWLHWSFRVPTAHVFATYNCHRDNFGREQAEIERIMHSVGGGVVESDAFRGGRD